VRRANPRDALGFRSVMSARRRLIRRGMPYGPAYRDGEEGPPPGGRGLLFVAYNARIAEQFEFVQSLWLNSGLAFGVGTGPDLIAGQWPSTEPPTIVVDRGDGAPTVLAPPAPIVQTRGGEYFLVPAIPALRWLAGVSPPHRQPP
jgi:hypothetical protein